MGARKDLTYLQDYASSKGGECLGQEYLGILANYMWKCSKGHTWSASANSICNTKTWCPICSGRVNASCNLGGLQHLAESRGGKCLSDTYHNVDTKYLWQCEKGHIWSATFYHVKNNQTWCPNCANVKTKVNLEAEVLVAEKGGRILGKLPILQRDKFDVICKANHIWKACINKLKQGQWCPYCVGKLLWGEDSQKVLRLQRIQRIATTWGGVCLSREYISNSSKLDFICKNGHKWKADPKKYSWDNGVLNVIKHQD